MGLAWDVWWSGGENTRGFKKLRAGSKRRPSARRGRAQEWARSLARELGAADSSIRHIIGFGATFETWRNFGEDSDIDLDQSGWHRCLVERMTLDIDGVRAPRYLTTSALMASSAASRKKRRSEPSHEPLHVLTTAQPTRPNPTEPDPTTP
ncbi:MAG: hypothetical protein ACQETQ_11675 [Spirochaetota bacterium]